MDLPSLKFLSLGCMALNGDDRDDRKVNMSESFQYKNTLVMKDLPSLTQLNGENGNFGNIGIFTFTNIPLLNRKSISFMTTPFDSTKRVNVENASGILGYLKSLKKPVHGKSKKRS
ncbi:hypothetical protein WA538_003863 [Blastocystis sp. DL]